MNRIASTIIYPSKNDPRWIFSLYALAFVIFALLSPGFVRTPEQFLTAFLTCTILDSLLIFYYKKIVLFPLSGMLSSIGIFLMCDSIFIWPFFLAALLTILSKHFLTINGRHIFNPNNFGVVLLALFFPSYMTITAGRWGGMIEIMFALLIGGLLLAYRVNKLALIFSYVLTFFLGALIRSQISGLNFLTVVGPSTGTAFQLFIFYHITDPLTTPAKRKHQIIFAILLGIIDAFLRYKQNKFAPFLSFFIMTGLYSFFKAKFELDVVTPWKLAKMHVDGKSS